MPPRAAPTARAWPNCKPRPRRCAPRPTPLSRPPNPPATRSFSSIAASTRPSSGAWKPFSAHARSNPKRISSSSSSASVPRPKHKPPSAMPRPAGMRAPQMAPQMLISRHHPPPQSRRSQCRISTSSLTQRPSASAPSAHAVSPKPRPARRPRAQHATPKKLTSAPKPRLRPRHAPPPQTRTARATKSACANTKKNRPQKRNTPPSPPALASPEPRPSGRCASHCPGAHPVRWLRAQASASSSRSLPQNSSSPTRKLGAPNRPSSVARSV